jgi:predicted transcriptional regulator
MVKRRLEELELEQKDLATAAEVTESYISQLLTRKKLPPTHNRCREVCKHVADYGTNPTGR